MLEIHVYLGLDTYPNDKKSPKLNATHVAPDPAAAHSGDDILWHFHALNDKIQSVSVTFNDKSDTFFECRDSDDLSNTCWVNLRSYEERRNAERKAWGGATKSAKEATQRVAVMEPESKTAVGRHGRLLGTAPSLRYRGVKVCKYTIKAYAGKGTPGGSVIEKFTLDPNIVTCDP